VPRQALDDFAAVPARASAEELASVLAIQCVIQGRGLGDYAIMSEDRSSAALRVVSIGERIYKVARLLLQAETKLTKRESQVLELLVTGIANKEIGNKINLSERTVKFHVSSLLTKYHVKKREELIRRMSMRVRPMLVKQLMAEAS
jgi:DNA-binding NarL/FixJ family response regulator